MKDAWGNITNKLFWHFFPLPFKGKGVLVVLYMILSIFPAAFFMTLLSEKFPSYFPDEDLLPMFSIMQMLTGIITFFTADDYYKDDVGNRIKVDLNNQFLFIKMKYWTYICWLGAIIALCFSDMLKIILQYK